MYKVELPNEWTYELAMEGQRTDSESIPELFAGSLLFLFSVVGLSARYAPRNGI